MILAKIIFPNSLFDCSQNNLDESSGSMIYPHIYVVSAYSSLRACWDSSIKARWFLSGTG